MVHAPPTFHKKYLSLYDFMIFYTGPSRRSNAYIRDLSDEMAMSGYFYFQMGVATVFSNAVPVYFSNTFFISANWLGLL